MAEPHHPTGPSLNTLARGIKRVMAAIYFDINCISTFRGIAESTPNQVDVDWYRSECNQVHEFLHTATTVLPNTTPGNAEIRTNYALEKLGWMVFSICAHSVAFRVALTQAQEVAWNPLMLIICRNRKSVEVFARSRSLDWRGPLLTLVGYNLPGLQDALGSTDILSNEHPHHFVRTLDGQLRFPMYNGYTQSRIKHCIFDTDMGEEDDQIDPTIRKPVDGECDLCKSPDVCQCLLASLAEDQVELVEYEDRGIGVRALANFKKRHILDQFVGVILPPLSNYDSVYPLEHPVDPGSDETVAVISPEYYGNWTRFINHSCNPCTEFARRTVGTHSIMTVEVARDISFGEEITVDYGEQYWGRKGRVCKCGEPNCRYSK